VAQEKGWKSDGKRWTRTEEASTPFVMPTTRFIEVPEKQEGAFLGTKYVGKQLQPTYFLEVPLATETVKGHECSWRMVYEKKSSSQYHFCLMNGAEKPCSGMSASGECLGMK
jgi:hypothetical protein